MQVGGFNIPAGIPIFLPLYIAHRDPAVWPRADEFLPERFLHVSEGCMSVRCVAGSCQAYLRH